MPKYHNKKTVIDGITFDSIAESTRYIELKLLEHVGEISGLRVHPVYELIPKFTDAHGSKHRALTYEADFEYTENGVLVAEDVKGVETDVFKIKRKLFAYYKPDIKLVVSKV